MTGDASTLAWWVTGGLRGERSAPAVGSVAAYEGELILGESGLHGSRSPLAALAHAAGPVMCRVRLGGRMVEDESRVCAERREVLWTLDATEVLHGFERWCFMRAAEALHAHELDVSDSVAPFVRDARMSRTTRETHRDVVARALETAHEHLRAAGDALREARWRAEERGGSAEDVASSRRRVARTHAEVAAVETMLRALAPELLPAKTAESIALAFAWLASAESPVESFDEMFEASFAAAHARMDEELERRLSAAPRPGGPRVATTGPRTAGNLAGAESARDEPAPESSGARVPTVPRTPVPRPPGRRASVPMVEPIAPYLPVDPRYGWARCPRCGLTLAPRAGSDLQRAQCPFCGHRGLVRWAREPVCAVRDTAAASLHDMVRPIAVRCIACEAYLDDWVPDDGASCLFCGEPGTLQPNGRDDP